MKPPDGTALLDGGPEAFFAYRRAMLDVPMSPSTSALVLVDLQYGSAAGDYGYGRAYRALGYADIHDGYMERIERVVIPAIRRLQQAFRTAGGPVIFLTVGSLTDDFSDMAPRFRRGAAYWRERGIEPPYARVGSREIQILDEIAPREGETVLRKAGASAFTSTDLNAMLLDRGIGQIALCGVSTAYCVKSTLRDAADRGFDVTLVEDGCADVTNAIHERGVASCSAFARIASSELVIQEIAPEPVWRRSLGSTDRSSVSSGASDDGSR